MEPTAVHLLQAGYVGSLDVLAQIRELVGDPHSGAGGRAYAVTLAGGLSFEVLPDRGLDIGACWYRGMPIGWRSALGSPGPAPTPSEWLGRFGGGLLVTCGLDNIGAPRGRYGQHGSHHDTRAHDVAVNRVVGPDGAPGIRITGTVDSVEVFGRRVRLYREISSYADAPAVYLADRVVNEGAWAAPVALLYHFNLGAPLVLPGTRIWVDAAERLLKEETSAAADWSLYPDPVDRVDEAVWCHSGLQTKDGVASARVVSPEGLTCEISWRAAELPLMMEWVFPPRQSWALGIEPSNAPLWGAERDSAGAGVPVLEPGATLETSLTVRLSGGDRVPADGSSIDAWRLAEQD